MEGNEIEYLDEPYLVHFVQILQRVDVTTPRAQSALTTIRFQSVPFLMGAGRCRESKAENQNFDLI